MRQSSFPIAPVIFSGMIALALVGCRPSQSVSQNQNKPIVHGEPIRGESIVAIATSQTVAMPSGLAGPAANRTVMVVPAPVVEIPKPATIPIPDKIAGGYSIVGFDKLASYNFEVDDAPVTNRTAADKANDQIPSRVKLLNDQKVSIKGFMLPLKVADGTVTEFLIMKDQSMCCYGSVPKITEWVSVKTPGKGVKPIMDQPISILGTLHVGALRENGYLVGIYQMDGDKLDTSSN